MQTVPTCRQWATIRRPGRGQPRHGFKEGLDAQEAAIPQAGRRASLPAPKALHHIELARITPERRSKHRVAIYAGEGARTEPHKVVGDSRQFGAGIASTMIDTLTPEHRLHFSPTPIPGAHILKPERMADDRGYFARTWCQAEFARKGIDVKIVQASVSQNRLAGTLRGLHFSWWPSQEGKLVRCERGRILDVILDLRPTSPAFLSHFAVILDDKQGDALFIPPGVAHGFQTLVDDTGILYMMTDVYNPDLADGVRFDDPVFGISWPLPVSSIAERDRHYPDFDTATHNSRYELAHGISRKAKV
jgi:dTDP-4-dehydrorhamnose 3,5-epimerase